VNADGLYLHFPFCRRKCSYCTFCSTTELALLPELMAALRLEVETAGGDDRLPVNTVYLGGGTPSLLSGRQAEKLMRVVQTSFRVAQDAEITIEVNPGAALPDRLRAYRACGFNRVSIGVQSFDDTALALLGRIHSAADARQAVRAARAAGFDNLSLDLIFGWPGQTRDDWQRDIESAAALAPEHLSCYLLTVEPETPIHAAIESGALTAVSDTVAAGLLQQTRDALTACGYHQYEISNYALRPELASVHNRKYWSQVPYIGCGPSAHSYDGSTRRWNYSSLRRYLAAMEKGNSPVAGRERLTTVQHLIERIYLGLRTVEGLDTKRFEEDFGICFTDRFGDLVASLQRQNMVLVANDRCALTEQGMSYADSITDMFVSLT